MNPEPRVVLDTNVVLSALVFRHRRLAPLRSLWQQARFDPLVSTPTIEELVRTLTYPKFRLGHAEQRELLGDYLPWCTVVSIAARLPRIPSCHDPGDLPFLQLAILGKAHYLVTGDADLLALAGKVRCRIVSPTAFLASFGLQQEER